MAHRRSRGEALPDLHVIHRGGGAPRRFLRRGHPMTNTTKERRRRTPLPVAPPTGERRAAHGKAARAEVPRESHAEFTPAPDRIDAVTLLEGQALTRVPELLPIRYGRMAASSFAFFRGAALPMASDLAETPRSGLMVQACGDAHLANFGAL